MYNVLITGSSRGLGLELVQYVAAHQNFKGGLVIATARKCSPQLDKVVAASDGSVAFVALDVADEESVKKSAEEVKSALRERSLDMIINCAGVHSETQGKWLKSDMGGQDADLTLAEGAEAVLKLALSADRRDNGRFKNIHVPGWDKYDGHDVPWVGENGPLGDSGSRPRGVGQHGQNPTEWPPPTAVSTTSDDGSNYHAMQAKDIIQIDLQNSLHISRERQSLLKSALELVSSIADSQTLTAMEEEPRSHDPPYPIPETPPRELLFMLLPGPPESLRIQWPDHISDKSYAAMATTLLRAPSELNASRFHQYCVCIYVKAIFCLYQTSRTTDDPVLKSELSKSKVTYVAAAMRSTGQFNILQPPDLSAIQSLLSSALLMQHLGRPCQCWLFVSYAARQITALNYHKICRRPAASDLEHEICSAVYWCYYLDSTLSSLLCRPTSLPYLEISPTDLIVLAPSSPYDSLLRVLLDLAQVQGNLREISCGGRNGPSDRALETCQLLNARMHDILPRLQSSRDCHPKMVQYDWVGVDFCFYAIFVEIHRTRLKNAFSPAVHRECLVYARKSLQAFLFLQQHPAELPGFDDPYPSFLTWTLLFYPLSAFFVVFCNIIGTMNHDDYELMRQIIKGLVPFKEDCHLGKLLTLLQSLEHLCKPLFHSPIEGGGGSRGGFSEGSVAQRTFLAPGDLADNPVSTGAFPSGPLENHNGSNQVAPDTNADLSADWLMWQLFNSQVPAGWLNHEIDPFDV
ncbi:fungal specific transcription factor domain-containing protein [Aspergillus homomorphus CBS 101889]|uniref:Xylanolytic transcriptional activator regulatory domain-containing protein n=1 Tax=Aspergillus homomorphus (strain CBS 101889) TaxID=1450537 RepID=A0A395HKW9_ASPHC|nr:hypothetical protein BO97DRAFT_473980 [Aspergillus homomorphus CBS 101889]RAL06924.1 hypothetical protein BO97DRAFT_473980 [Aspergillus homomorphus CBS 101889]